MSGSPEPMETAPAAPGGPPRRRMAGFVGVFVFTVLLLLTAYRYTVDTRVNDWYLFQVARHTSWVLGKIGHSSELEGRIYGQTDADVARASLKAWGEGREDPSEEEVQAASDAPLTPWERWSYRAVEGRVRGHKGSNGPGISFVLRPGLSTEISEINGEITKLREDESLDGESRETRLAELRGRVQELRNIQQEVRRGERPASDDMALMFPFIVVAECGAIEVMAIFLAAVLAFPAAWWMKLIGLAGGLPLMYSVNIFRLSFLGVLGALDTENKWFKFAHEYAWQAVYIVFVVAVWLVWVEYIVNGARPGERLRGRGPLWFCAKFLACVAVFVAAWWMFLPYYGQFLLQVSGGILKYGLGMPIESGRIVPKELLNTGTDLVFRMADGRQRIMHIALLATNVPPYLALVAATGGLSLARRLRVMAYGFGILCAFHVLFIVIVMRFQETLMKASEVPTAVVLFFLTLPFLMWIVFAYWDRLAGGGGAPRNGAPAPPADAEKGGPAPHAGTGE